MLTSLLVMSHIFVFRDTTTIGTIFRKEMTLGGSGVFIGVKSHLTAVHWTGYYLTNDVGVVWIKLLISKVYVGSYYRPLSNDIQRT